MIFCVKVQNVCVEKIAEAESRQHGGGDAAEQRQKHREGEAEKLWENAAFREIICLFHIISS